jgi:Site-specific recombinase XerD
MFTLNKLTDNYLHYCTFLKKLNDKTIKAYRIDLNQFSNFIKNNSLYYSKDTINNYIYMLHKHYKPKSVKRKIVSIKAFFNYLVYEEILENNPFDKINTCFREPKCLPRTIPFNLIETLMNTMYQELTKADTSTAKQYILRDITIIELLFATGMRISELCSLNIKQVDLISNKILINGKGNKERILQIGNPEVINILNEYYVTFQNDIISTGWFFINRLHTRFSEQSVRIMIKNYAKKANISLLLTPHMFRHSVATLLLDADVDIRCIQQILGHNSITTTEIYTHVSTAKQESILSTKHPRNIMSINNKNKTT